MLRQFNEREVAANFKKANDKGYSGGLADESPLRKSIGPILICLTLMTAIFLGACSGDHVAVQDERTGGLSGADVRYNFS